MFNKRLTLGAATSLLSKQNYRSHQLIVLIYLNAQWGSIEL